MTPLTCLLLNVALVLVLISCANTPDPGPPIEYVDGGAETGKPFAFNEAKLPEGFPPPGPVGRVVRKSYPAYRAAVARGQDQGRMFNVLFAHIKEHDIAMTAPVEMAWPAGSDRPDAMAFLYRRPGMGATGDAGGVEVVDVPPAVVLSVTVRGDYNRKNFDKALGELNAWLDANPGRFERVGGPRYLGYNSPMVPGFLRIGEVQVPVREPEPGPPGEN